jgi:hypothetical protein
MRLDGQAQANGGYGHNGDEPPLIVPGGSWKEVVVLRASRSSTGGNPGLGAIFMSDTTGLVAMTPGRHTVAFQWVARGQTRAHFIGLNHHISRESGSERNPLTHGTPPPVCAQSVFA